MKTAIFFAIAIRITGKLLKIDGYIIHAARQFVRIEFSFHPYNIYRDCNIGVPSGNKNVVKIAIFGLTHWLSDLVDWIYELVDWKREDVDWITSWLVVRLSRFTNLQFGWLNVRLDVRWLCETVSWLWCSCVGLPSSLVGWLTMIVNLWVGWLNMRLNWLKLWIRSLNCQLIDWLIGWIRSLCYTLVDWVCELVDWKCEMVNLFHDKISWFENFEFWRFWPPIHERDRQADRHRMTA